MKGRKKEGKKELKKGIQEERNKERKTKRKKYLDFIRNIQKERRKDLPLCTPFPLAREWFADNGLALNESKTQVMICTMDQLVPSIIQNLQEVVKLLGFILVPKLTWKSLTSNLSVKFSQLGMWDGYGLLGMLIGLRFCKNRCGL